MLARRPDASRSRQLRCAAGYSFVSGATPDTSARVATSGQLLTARTKSSMPANRAARSLVSATEGAIANRTTVADSSSTKLSAPKASSAGLCAEGSPIQRYGKRRTPMSNPYQGDDSEARPRRACHVSVKAIHFCYSIQFQFLAALCHKKPLKRLRLPADQVRKANNASRSRLRPPASRWNPHISPKRLERAFPDCQMSITGNERIVERLSIKSLRHLPYQSRLFRRNLILNWFLHSPSTHTNLLLACTDTAVQ